jgi:hypothetical protein
MPRVCEAFVCALIVAINRPDQFGIIHPWEIVLTFVCSRPNFYTLPSFFLSLPCSGMVGKTAIGLQRSSSMF